jgi:galactoside O-acetyltransferase
MVGCNFIFESTEGIIEIGERTFINGGTNLISRTSINIGNDVTIAWGCYIYDHNAHSLEWQERQKDLIIQIENYRENRNMVLNKDWSTVKTKPITIKDKVWIGFDCLIFKGVTVGEGAIIGAKSVVTKDVEPWTVVAGNPAKVVKRLNKE